MSIQKLPSIILLFLFSSTAFSQEFLCSQLKPMSLQARYDTQIATRLGALAQKNIDKASSFFSHNHGEEVLAQVSKKWAILNQDMNAVHQADAINRICELNQEQPLYEVFYKYYVEIYTGQKWTSKSLMR